MGRSRYQTYEARAPYFVTCTVLNWMPLFTRPDTVAIVLDALRYRQEHLAWRIYVYVVLENHLHSNRSDPPAPKSRFSLKK